MISKKHFNFSLIFDMDGVIVDNYAFHEKSWEIFCQNHNIQFNPVEFKTKIIGGSNRKHLEFFFGKILDESQIEQFEEEKEIIYLNLHQATIKPLNGLIDFLQVVKSNKIKIALATSAPRKNVEFILNATNCKSYFDVIVDSLDVTFCKPDPEIYFLAISKLNETAKNCFVFEDSMTGISAAKNAGTNVIGVATTHKKEDLIDTCLAINNFTEISLEKLIELNATVDCK